MNPLQMGFFYLDALHREAADALGRLGYGARSTPYRLVGQGRPFELRRYGDNHGPSVLLVPAPIKDASIWDLAPQASAVCRCLNAGLRTYLIAWQSPGAGDSSLGLDDYAGRALGAARDLMRRDGGSSKPILIGHSLGGTFAAIHACRWPGEIRGLGLIGAPLTFGPDIGGVGRFIRAMGHPPAIPGNIPGSLLSLASALAAPSSFVYARSLEALASLGQPDRLHLLMDIERWTLADMPMSRKLFDQLTRSLYGENALVRGRLNLLGRRLNPAALRCPIAAVVDKHCDVAPPAAVMPFLDATHSTATRVFEYREEAGVGLQHVGPLVGRNANHQLWPDFLDWLTRSLSDLGGSKRGSGSARPDF